MWAVTTLGLKKSAITELVETVGEAREKMDKIKEHHPHLHVFVAPVAEENQTFNYGRFE